MDYIDLHLADECPEIGSGHRHVLVVSLTPNHAVILEPSSGAHATMTRESGPKYHGYDELARGQLLLPYDPERMVQRLLKNSQANGTYDAVVRDACLALGGIGLPRLTGDTQDAIVYGGSGEETPTVATPGEKSGAFIRRLWMTGLHTPDQIVAYVHASFPGSKAQRSDVSWNVSKLIKDGVAGVPAWPKAK